MSGPVRAGAAALTNALMRGRDRHGAALVSFVTAGFPSRDGFGELLRRIAAVSDAVEIGVPFSDPMADGLTIQRSSRTALEGGVTLRWILETLGDGAAPPDVPLVLMSYLNPLLAFGLEPLAAEASRGHVAGFVVPDLPLEESAPLREALDARGLALVQLVTPATPEERMRRLCEASRGFVYAVTVTGTTGGGEVPGDVLPYLDRVRERSRLPVLAGFGIRHASQVAAIAGHADGVIVGSALIEALERGEDPVTLLRGLREGSGGAEEEPS